MKNDKRKLCPLLLAVCMLIAGCGAAGSTSKEPEAYAADEPFVIDYEVDPNDASFDPSAVEPRTQKTLEGKTIYWLGSSVVNGAMAEGYSMADYLAVRNNMTCIKEAVDGTTLHAAEDGRDYVARLLTSELFDPEASIDAFICQISTNDDLNPELYGEVSSPDVTDRDSLDLSTSIGGVEYIISYVHDTWNCPVYFFSGSYFGTEPVNGEVREAFWNSGDEYGELVARVQAAADKWNAMEGYTVEVIDLYNDKAFNESLTAEEYTYYMNQIRRGEGVYADDPIHPRKAGYLHWWTPYFEEFLNDRLQ